MAEISQRRWSQYSVGRLSKTHSMRSDCMPLLSVTHVTHVDGALEILRRDSIKAGLIYDESRLNRRRVLVVWLSPNDWTRAGGYRYGNIAFDLDWKKLIARRRFYWVGAMEYNPPACRILITRQDRDEGLEPYYPQRGNGPWVTDGDKHYWNQEYYLEFMLECDISLSPISGIRFVKHHKDRCSINPAHCRDCGRTASDGAARLPAGTCARGLLLERKGVWTNFQEVPTQCLLDAWKPLSKRPGRGITNWRGLVKVGTKQADAVARAGMNAFFASLDSDRRSLFGMFESNLAATEACAEVIEDDLGLNERCLPLGCDDEV